VVEMSEDVSVTVGGGLCEDLAAFRSAWERAARGETVQPQLVLAFESREGLASVMTGER
jgi:hypothetical protein